MSKRRLTGEIPYDGETWKTKDGRKFVILDTNAGGKYPVQAVNEKRNLFQIQSS
jgi:hypothetical protein